MKIIRNVIYKYSQHSQYLNNYTKICHLSNKFQPLTFLA